MNVLLFKGTLLLKMSLLCMLLSCVNDPLMAQTPAAHPGRTITVIGSASMEVPPDAITLRVELSEVQEKPGKASLPEQEKKFFEVLKKLGITTAQVQPFGGSASWFYWWMGQSNPVRATSYQLQLDSKTDLLTLVKALHEMGVNAIYVVDRSADGMEAKRKAVKIEAIKAAKEKAMYLMEAIGGAIGRTLEVVEVEAPFDQFSTGSFNLNNAILNAQEPANPFANAGSIILRYEIKVVFEISD